MVKALKDYEAKGKDPSALFVHDMNKGWNYLQGRLTLLIQMVKYQRFFWRKMLMPMPLNLVGQWLILRHCKLQFDLLILSLPEFWLLWSKFTMAVTFTSDSAVSGLSHSKTRRRFRLKQLWSSQTSSILVLIPPEPTGKGEDWGAMPDVGLIPK